MTESNRIIILLLLLLMTLRDAESRADAPKMQASANHQITKVPSKDGTLIGVECAGSGPTLLFVHGGVGDRTRWTPMFPLLSSRFTVCAMDRCGHGLSQNSSDYSLNKEAEDVTAVVNSRKDTVFVLGHSYGGVATLEATFLTNRIAKLILYEPPLQDRIDLKVTAQMEKLIDEGKREEAMLIFLKQGVKMTDDQVDSMRSRPSWPELVSTVDLQPRQMRAIASYQFNPKRMATVSMPTLLLTGSETASPELKQAIRSLQGNLPHSTLVVLQGQAHNAMDQDRETLAKVIADFLTAKNKTQ